MELQKVDVYITQGFYVPGTYSLFLRGVNVTPQLEAFAAKVNWEPTNLNQTPRQPTLNLSSHMAQSMMDDLWRMGIRPTGEIGSTGHLSAIEAHITTLKDITDRLLRRFVDRG